MRVFPFADLRADFVDAEAGTTNWTFSAEHPFA